MTFPAVQLDVRTELNLGGTWTDITAFTEGPVTKTRGHADESTQTSPSELTLALRNDDGRFSARNPNSPYYGNLGRNTPVRLSLPAQSTYLRLENDQTSFASCPDTAALQITTGVLSVRIDLTPSTTGHSILMAKWAGGSPSWAFVLGYGGSTPGAGAPGDATLSLWHWDGTNAFVTPSHMPIPYFSGRIALRADYNIIAQTISFFTAPTMAGPWTVLGSPQPTAATSLAPGSGQPVHVGWTTSLNDLNSTVPIPGITGRIYEAQILSGATGTTLVADPVFSSQAAGTASFPDGHSNTWTMNGTSEISNRDYRFHGEIPAWPQSWSPVSTNNYVNVDCGGLLRRIGRSGVPVRSPVCRQILAETVAPLAEYWTMEDGNVTAFGSSTGGTPMTYTGTPGLAADTSFAGSDPLPVLGGGSQTDGPVRPGYGAADLVMGALLHVPATGDTNQATVMRFYVTGGTISRVDLTYGTGGSLTLKCFSSAGSQLFTSGPVGFNVNGQPMAVLIAITGTSPFGWHIDSMVPGAVGLGSSGSTGITGTLGQIGTVQLNSNGTFGGTAYGHCFVMSEYSGSQFAAIAGALNAWQGEAAGDRFARITAEEGLQARIVGASAATVAMGVQGRNTISELLQECVDADLGQWFEPRQCLGWGYRTSDAMGNQPVGVPFDYHLNQLAWPLDSTEDDQTIVNDVTVSNTAGLTVRVTDTTSRLSALAPPAGAGTYDTSVSVNVPAAAALSDIAGWMVHTGTVNEPRYPALNLDMAEPALAALFYQILAADIGDRYTIANTPAWLPPGGVDQLIQYVQETYDIMTFTIAWTGIPASPWNVMILDDPVYGRCDTDGSALTSNITTTATSASVTTTAGPVWTTATGDRPFDIVIGGERMTVTNVTGATSPQTFTLTRSVNGVVKAHSAGDDVRLFTPPVLGI